MWLLSGEVFGLNVNAKRTHHFPLVLAIEPVAQDVASIAMLK